MIKDAWYQLGPKPRVQIIPEITIRVFIIIQFHGSSGMIGRSQLESTKKTDHQSSHTTSIHVDISQMNKGWPFKVIVSIILEGVVNVL